MDDLRGRIVRRRRRRRFVGATAVVTAAAGLALALAPDNNDSDQLDIIDDPTAPSVESSTTATSPSTTTTAAPVAGVDAPSTTATVVGPGGDPDAAAAAHFLDAWARGDRDAMLEIADPQAVDLALDYFGSPTSDLDCITQTNGQLDCEVQTTSGRWAYFLIGQPGAAEGRIWWLSETAPGEGGGP